jgi:hypothetical protein
MAIRMGTQATPNRRHVAQRPRLKVLQGGETASTEGPIRVDPPLWKDLLPLVLSILAMGWAQGLLEGVG